ncbi:myotrophin [Exaiptasia diaphana]|uniref:Ankyrin repeat protein n=1 Tax=Exaiptasia diaphana TaxID=2652724 RepID=A0A913Y9P7_EXADI|nr:myotrophin [Exaiptasia diaphana]KXJ28325.1 Myotrophin [Exaiptasia diaphana]
MSIVNAIRSDSVLELEHLLRQPGRYVNAPIKNGRPPLHFAIQENKKRIAAALLNKHHADIDMTDDDDYTPLMIAIDTNNPDLVKFLIEMGADTSGKYPDGKTYQESTENVKIIELLRDKKNVK